MYEIGTYLQVKIHLKLCVKPAFFICPYVITEKQEPVTDKEMN